MKPTTFEERRQLEALDAASLERHQLARLNALLDTILPSNRFYAEKLAEVPRPIASLSALAALPYTYKQELLSADHSTGTARNLTYGIERYTRFHQTSGTSGRPLAVLDTPEDWQWWMECWEYVLDSAEVRPPDRVLMAFSFGPFVGFWSAFDAAMRRGCLMIPAGGMNTLSRLELLRTSGATVVFCTPSYALHLAEIAAQRKLDVGSLDVRTLVLAGEPGGSVPAIRKQIEQAWQARVVDHCGATEVGPWGYADAEHRGLHVIESEFIAEFLSVETGGPAKDGELSELIITNLGRVGCPLIRYRTGDLVRPTRKAAGSNRFVLLEGGVLGRTDDMLIIRGINIFPSAIEQILRSFPEVLEYRLTARRVNALDELTIEVEDRLEQPARIADELRLRLGLRVEVVCVTLGSLPRFEGKGQRFIDRRTS